MFVKTSMKLPKIYEPNQYENDIYALWEKSRAFVPVDRGTKSYFSLVAPPPNANANLHIGYGLTMAVEDIIVRYSRLRGKATLFVPGADHAGFETQVVYEKHLAKEGKSRFDFTREQLYKQIWDFVAQNRASSERQFRRLGASVDWEHFTFTLDDKVIKTAYATFKKMWDEGLIYRGERLVNFCTFHGTAFADIEVEYKENKSNLWYIRYPLTDGSGGVIVATTRPETMLGDTAVAVHDGDKRYKQFIGKTVKLPLTEREIPVIADAMVSTEFGTGAVKITPAHDPNDFEVAERHDLPKITVIDYEGKINNDAPEKYRGLTVQEAREAVVDDLKKQGYLVNIEPHIHSVGHCYKCGTVIQPLLKEQWFVAMKLLATSAIAALKNNKINFYPAGKQDQLIHYLEGLKDWNISRQIAWGIPIPAFQNTEDPDDWIFDERVGEEIITQEGKLYHRDPDVFDTWFSSSSWPYVTLNYPGGEDFKQFYPLSLMETGGEILYPWVSRMIMLGLYVTGEVPFTSVYIHGYVMAEDGAKMSKSLGNVVDLTEVIDKYGSDALRMGIVAGRTAAVNRGYDHRKIIEARNFSNKIWNIARFIEDKVGGNYSQKVISRPKTPVDHWIINKLLEGSDSIGKDLDNYRFAEAYERLYHLVWDDVADWYIEASKQSSNQPILAYVLETILKLAHPFAPFVTETIWQTLAWQSDTLLATQSWPIVHKSNNHEIEQFEKLKQIVTEIRYLVTELRLEKPHLYYQSSRLLADNKTLIARLAGLGSVSQIEDGLGLVLTQSNDKAWLDVDRETIKHYVKRLEQQLKEQGSVIKQLQTRLANKFYIRNAPSEVVQESREQLEQATKLYKKLEDDYRRFDRL